MFTEKDKYCKMGSWGNRHDSKIMTKLLYLSNKKTGSVFEPLVIN